MALVPHRIHLTGSRIADTGDLFAFEVRGRDAPQRVPRLNDLQEVYSMGLCYYNVGVWKPSVEYMLSRDAALRDRVYNHGVDPLTIPEVRRHCRVVLAGFARELRGNQAVPSSLDSGHPYISIVVTPFFAGDGHRMTAAQLGAANSPSDVAFLAIERFEDVSLKNDISQHITPADRQQLVNEAALNWLAIRRELDRCAQIFHGPGVQQTYRLPVIRNLLPTGIQPMRATPTAPAPGQPGSQVAPIGVYDDGSGNEPGNPMVLD